MIAHLATTAPPSVCHSTSTGYTVALLILGGLITMALAVAYVRLRDWWYDTTDRARRGFDKLAHGLGSLLIAGGIIGALAWIVANQPGK